jgi:LacI family transcriptional regulator
MARRIPHVAVAVDASRSYGRRILAGIADYAESHVRWSMYLEPRSPGTYRSGWLRDWRGDGILAWIEDRPTARRFARSRIPLVELFGHHLDLGLPTVGNDDEAIGRLAAEHLLGRQLRRFAFSGYPGEPWVERRFAGFAAGLRRRGFGVARFRSSREAGSPARWEREQQRLVEGLRALPKPAGLLACSDRHAQRVLDACRRAGIAVPDEVAVLGVDDDEEICRLSDPPLSSVKDDPRRVGFEAARLLDRLMSRPRRPPRKPLLIPPQGVAERRSTDVTAVEDRAVAEAMRSIRRRACEGLSVPDLLREAHLSRAAFYRRFRAALGRTPHAELLRARLDRAKELLRQTSMTLEEIADRAGFAHPEYLSAAFRREVGTTPGAYRRES